MSQTPAYGAFAHRSRGGRGVERDPTAVAVGHGVGRSGRRADGRRVCGRRPRRRVRDAVVRVRRGAPALPLPGGGGRVRSRARDLRDEGVPVHGRWPGSRTTRGCCSTSPPGGELHVALAAGVPAGACALHGNNKSLAELGMAIEAGVRHIVVDSFDELDRLDVLAAVGCRTDAEGPVADHAGRPRPHPRVHRHRAGRLEVRVQPRQRRCAAGGRPGPAIVVGRTGRGCTATSARTCSRRRRSPRRPR